MKYIYHGTSDAHIASLRQSGVTPPSYWGTQRVATYYAQEEAEAAGGNPIVLSCRFDEFEPTAFDPDYCSLEEPLTHTLQTTEDAIAERWERSEKTWKDSLNIVESVRYNRVVPFTMIQIHEEQQTLPLWHAERRVGDRRKPGPSLGTFYTDNENVARGLADVSGTARQVDVVVAHMLAIPANVSGPWYDIFSPTTVNELLARAGVRYVFDEDGEEQEFWRFVDDGGRKFISAMQRAGYDAVRFPEFIQNTEQMTTLVFHTKKMEDGEGGDTSASSVSALGTVPTPALGVLAPPTFVCKHCKFRFRRRKKQVESLRFTCPECGSTAIHEM